MYIKFGVNTGSNLMLSMCVCISRRFILLKRISICVYGKVSKSKVNLINKKKM